MTVSKFTISLTEEVTASLDKRLDHGSARSTIVNRSLDRYFAVMANCRRILRKLLSDKEMGLILDSLNGVAHYDTYTISLTWAGIQDSLEDGLAEKWGVDGPALVAKLKGLDYAHTMALVDATEMWWNRAGRGEQPHYREALEEGRGRLEIYPHNEPEEEIDG